MYKTFAHHWSILSVEWKTRPHETKSVPNYSQVVEIERLNGHANFGNVSSGKEARLSVYFEKLYKNKTKPISIFPHLQKDCGYTSIRSETGMAWKANRLQPDS